MELIYGDHVTHSFLGRQIRGLLLFSFASVAWLVAVALSVFGRPIEQWITSEFGNSSLVRNFLIVTLPVLAMILAMFVLASIYRVARPVTTTIPKRGQLMSIAFSSQNDLDDRTSQHSSMLGKKLVSRALYSSEVGRPSGISLQFFAQTQNVIVDGASARIIVVTPNFIEQFVP